MARMSVPQASKRRFSSGKPDAPGSALETQVQALEQMCRRLERQPRIRSGVSNEEIIEILMAECGRLKATLGED